MSDQPRLTRKPAVLVMSAACFAFAIPPSLQGTAPSIKIYTVTGEMVRELSGLAWDGKNTAGNLVASGTYVFLVKTGAGTARGRVAVIRVLLPKTEDATPMIPTIRLDFFGPAV